MKSNPRLTWLAVLAAGLVRSTGQGQEAAIVTENHINVRGQPSLSGEVITQMKKGEKVIVLDEIPVEKPKPGEPAKWARIRMPENTPVWLFASFVDSENKTVKVSRLNLRAGPGENFSIVGRLERGEAVKVIRTVDDWMEIEAPEKTFAFIAAEFVSKVASKPEPPVAKTDKIGPVPEPRRTEPERMAPPAETNKTEVPPVAASETATPGTTTNVAEQPASKPAQETSAVPPTLVDTTPATTKVEPAPVTTPATVTPPPAPITLPTETTTPAATESAPPPKRVVTREGIVRGTRSIQAPTWYELVGADTGRPINYLHTLDPELNLKNYRGKKIIVTGEEGIDPRWSKTPILEIATIKVVP